MAIPTTTVRGGLYNPANSVPMTRAEAYVSPYIRAGWENWKLSLAEAQAVAEQEDSAYKARLAYYKLLTEAKSDLQAQLARLQETSFKNGADVDKENFTAETKIAIENADAQNQARRTGAEEAGKNNRAETQARIDVYRAETGLVGARAQADATREASPSTLSKNADAIRGSVTAAYDPNNPNALRDAVASYKKAALGRGDQIEDVRKGMDALVRSLEAITPDAVKGSAFKNLGADTVLMGDLRDGAVGNRKAPAPDAPPAPSTNIANTGYTAVGVAKPAPLVAQAADTSDLEAKLAALDAKLKAIDVSAPERKSLIEEARAVYAKNFRGFPGATKAQPKPVATPKPDRLQATKIEAARKAKILVDAYNLDISDPLNLERKTKVFKEFEDSEIKSVVDRLYDSKTSKTEAGVIEKQIQSQFEASGKLADAMAYYIYRKETTRPVAAAPNVPEVKTITVNPPNLNTPY